jgi:hypothetical protein
MDASTTKADIKKVLVDDLRGLYPSLSKDYFLSKYAAGENQEDYFNAFVAELRKIMDHAGINQKVFDQLPEPTCK